MGNTEVCHLCYIRKETRFMRLGGTLSGRVIFLFAYNTTARYSVSVSYALGTNNKQIIVFQAVYNLCVHKMGGSLYQRIEKECERHIAAALHSLVGQSPDLVVFLSLVERCWQDLCAQILMIRDIALYLDRTYVKQTPNVRSLWDMGLQLFRKHLSLSPEVEHKIVTGLLRMIEKERYLYSTNFW